MEAHFYREGMTTVLSNDIGGPLATCEKALGCRTRTPHREDAVSGASIYINARADRRAMVAFRVETHLTASV